MKRIILLIAVALVSFAAGLVGLYLAMPVIDPEGVEYTRSQLDSLLGRNAAPDSSFAEADSLTLPLEPLVRLDSMEAGADSAHSVMLEDHPQYIAMLDSLARLKNEHTRLARERSDLVDRLALLSDRIATADQVGDNAAELSATLTRLEDDELREILTQIDEATLTRLYHEATGRSKTRILASLPSERAARLVQRMMAAGTPAPMSTRLSSDVEVQ